MLVRHIIAWWLLLIFIWNLNILIIYDSMLILFVLSLLNLCVSMNDLNLFCMTNWLYDHLSLTWLHVSCLCGTHVYSLISNSLVSIIPISLAFTFAISKALFMLAFLLSQWLGVGSNDGLYVCLGAFWRRPIYWCYLEFDLWRLV